MQQHQQVHTVKAKNQDKVQLSTVGIEDFLDYQQNRYLNQNKPVPKTAIGEYHEYIIKAIEGQSNMIFDQLVEAEENVNTY